MNLNDRITTLNFCLDIRSNDGTTIPSDHLTSINTDLLKSIFEGISEEQGCLYFEHIGGKESVLSLQDGREKMESKGGSIYVVNACKNSSGLRVFSSLLAKEIGYQLNEEALWGSYYESKRGSITPWHFDKFDNIVVQIVGTKEWSFSISNKENNPQKNSDEYIEPTLIPEVAEKSILLKPGSMIFVPKGVWHKTETITGSSISVSFTVVGAGLGALMLKIISNGAITDKGLQNSVFGQSISDNLKNELIAAFEIAVSKFISKSKNK